MINKKLKEKIEEFKTGITEIKDTMVTGIDDLSKEIDEKVFKKPKEEKKETTKEKK